SLCTHDRTCGIPGSWFGRADELRRGTNPCRTEREKGCKQRQGRRRQEGRKEGHGRQVTCSWERGFDCAPIFSFTVRRHLQLVHSSPLVNHSSHSESLHPCGISRLPITSRNGIDFAEELLHDASANSHRLHTYAGGNSMRQHTDWCHRLTIQICLLASVVMIATGCVSTDTHQKALDELEKTKKQSASQAAEMEALKKKSKAESDQLQQQLAGLQQNLDQETSQRKTAEQQAASLAQERAALETRSGELQSKLDSLEQEKG